MHRYAAPLLAAFVFGLAACGREPLPEAAVQAIAPPPSVRSEAAPERPLVRLTAAQAAELKVRSVTAGRDTAGYVLGVPGEVVPAPEHFAQVSAPIGGRVAEVYAHEGQAVRAGQPLVALESLPFANLVADYLQAVAEELYQQRQVERLQALVEKKISPRSQLDRTEADLSRARAGVAATYARLKALGISDEQLDRWSDAPRERPLLQVRAPISGTIDRHEVDLGQSVSDYQEMMTVVNTAHVLVRGFVSPDDAGMIRPGDPVTIRMKDVPGPAVAARVATINPAVDAESRSVTVNVLAATAGGWPMPGQTVRLEIRVSNPRPVMMLPLSAVQYEGEQATVFVRRDERTYEKRPVEIERVTADAVVVTAGLEAGEAVAASQVFSLKALGRFGEYAE